MIKTKNFGTLADGRQVSLYTMTNGNNNSVSITDFGGRIVSILMHDDAGVCRDVVLGYDTLEQYVDDQFFIGGIIGRYAGRLGGCSYTIDNKKYNVTCNTDSDITLHGGTIGFDKVLWKAKTSSDDSEDTLVLEYLSVDGEQGFNGNLQLGVYYSWDNHDVLAMRVKASCDQDTVCNITNHAYFNLDGHDSDIRHHSVTLNSSKMLDMLPNQLPSGKILDISGTELDLNGSKLMGDVDLDYTMIKQCGGYDFSYVLDDKSNNYLSIDNKSKGMNLAGLISSKNSGLSMTLHTTKPTVQFYTCNSMTRGTNGKNGIKYGPHSAICIEPQFAPDAPNHNNLGNTILRKGEVYEHSHIFRFYKN